MAHQHENRDRHHHDDHKKQSGGAGMRPHMKRMMVVGVILMLIALAIYVMSDNEILQPGVTPTTLPPANP